MYLVGLLFAEAHSDLELGLLIDIHLRRWLELHMRELEEGKSKKMVKKHPWFCCNDRLCWKEEKQIKCLGFLIKNHSRFVWLLKWKLICTLIYSYRSWSRKSPRAKLPLAWRPGRAVEAWEWINAHILSGFSLFRSQLPHSARSLLATSEVELMISFSDNSSGKYTVRSNASPLGQLFNVLLQHKMSTTKRRSLFLSGACACKRERFVLTERASVLCVFVPFHFLLGS